MMAALVLVGAALVAALHAVGWVRLGRRSAVPLSPRRPALVMAGLGTIVVALASPLDALAHERFAAHMLQHILLTMVAAPLVLLADPFPAVLWALPSRLRRGLARGLVRGAWLRAVAATITAPAAAWLLHVGTLWAWHIPVLYDAAVADPALHALEHLSFFLTALLFWWPLIAPAPRLSPPPALGQRVVALVLAALQTATLGLLLAVADRPVYASYAASVDALADQARGGIIMWALGGAVDMAAVLALLWRFLSSQERAPSIDRPRTVRQNAC
jgi:cytochrome c oxidase assembly factor CtaG